MMLILMTAALVAVVSAAPQGQINTTPIPIVRSASDTKFDGNYAFSYETGNSIVREEVSEVLNQGSANEQRVVRGSYSYVDPDGNPFQVTYIVDGDGFRAEGARLPVPPPIPEEIQAALARNAAEEAQLSDAQRAEIDTGRYILQ
ncbi:endocuticle structural glycoprotein SgAbd-8 [Anabrus simplex]|uniref:endocuticle structural glycoprotein SgAbd-8 n=1 Tax=Anabrus simplex TaxID=316456 RepID=UPI0034DD6199